MRGTAILVCGGLMFAAVLTAGSTQAGVINVKRPAEDHDLKKLMTTRISRWVNAPVRDVPSSRNLLRRSKRQFPGVLGAAVQDTLRICALRVEFASVPDPSKITGDQGRFDLSREREGIPTDPPPHDRKYFSKHLEALDYYYSTMSYGSLHIESDVFPLANDGAYVLPDVGKYNPDGGVWTWTLDNLESFFKDAVTAADQDPDFAYSDYDAVVIFHAGSDWQNDISGDSPYDIPSFFISLAGSIAVDDSTHFIVDGSVIPETTSQDGFFNGINGVLAHETGHQLGLPDLYDTYSGLSVVGYWCLMDFGSGVGVVIEDTLQAQSYYVSGIVPASLSAWCKSYLGWAVPDTVDRGGSFMLRATELQRGFPSRDVLLVPINSYEYYLIENRQSDLDGDGLGFLLTDPSADSTGVIIGPVNANRKFNYEFDYILPGSGLLIWHIDRAMVDFGDPYDIVNAFRPRRGIRLVEADGIPDLGDFNSFYFLGSPDDPFRLGNNNRFADDTYPSTRSTTGCHSHIVIDNISASYNLMDLNVSFPWRRLGMPVAVGDSMRFGIPSLAVEDMDGDGRTEVLAAVTRAAWDDSLGVVWLRAGVCGFEVGALGTLVPEANWNKHLHGSHPSELVGFDLNGDGDLETVLSDETGRLYAFKSDGSSLVEDSDSLGSFDRVDGDINGVPVAFTNINRGGEPIVAVGTSGGLRFFCNWTGDHVISCDTIDEGVSTSQPVIADVDRAIPGLEIVYYRTGEVVIADPGSFEVTSAFPISPMVSAGGGGTLAPVQAFPEPGEVYLAAADMDRDPDKNMEIILVARSGWVWVMTAAGEELPGWGRKISGRVMAPPSIADVNGDRYLDLILNDTDYKTWVLHHSGARVEGWPRKWYGCSLVEWDEEFHPPDLTIPLPAAAVLDFDCDGRLDVVQGSLFECVTGWSGDGEVLSGFPFTLGGGSSALAVAEVRDVDTIVITGGGDGYLYGFSMPSVPVGPEGRAAPWRTAYFDITRNCVYPPELMPEEPEPGSHLLVERSFHAFPNPATGSSVTFSLETETGGRASIDIFDVSGAKVRSVGFEAVAKTEYPVDISGLGNGLYVCRLEIADGGRKTSDFFKLAVRR